MILTLAANTVPGTYLGNAIENQSIVDPLPTPTPVPDPTPTPTPTPNVTEPTTPNQEKTRMSTANILYISGEAVVGTIFLVLIFYGLYKVFIKKPEISIEEYGLNSSFNPTAYDSETVNA